MLRSTSRTCPVCKKDLSYIYRDEPDDAMQIPRSVRCICYDFSKQSIDTYYLHGSGTVWSGRV